jgi:predicted ATPase
MTSVELLEFLGNLPDNDVNLPVLAQQMVSGTGVVPFIGAGLSAPYRFPQWGAFIRDMAKRAGVADEVERHLDALQYEEAAELLQQRMHSRFQDLIAHYFGDQVLEGVEFRGAAALVPHVAVGPVITTNFDRLLENVFKQAGCPFPVTVWHDRVDAAIESMSHNGLLLLKLHGDWQFPGERVLTLSEYRAHYGKSKTKINFHLAIPHVLALMVTRPMLFLGCSLKQDRTGQIIRQLADRNPAFRHFAILEYPENEAQYRERIDELSLANIRPIWYPQKQHEKIEQILAFLAEKVPEPLRLVKKTAPDTLPAKKSTFIGRKAEQKDLREKILRYRLVTVVGAPGAGKTRLTVEVARALEPEFNACWFVPLSQLPDAAAIPQRIAHVTQTKGQIGKDLMDVVSAALKPGKQLLILDNCETAIEECGRLANKLSTECPELHLVLTSRVDLGNAVAAGAEHVYRVPPLELPDPERLPSLEALASIDSVELLLERASERSDLHLTEANALKVAKLCRGLDGIPLAVELVAAQLDMLSLDSVLEHWGDHLDFASTIGVGPEQQIATLRNTIRLSYDLLGREQNGERLRVLFRRLSVFHRGWTAEAALAVCGDLSQGSGGKTEKDVVELLKPLRRASLIEIEESAGVKRYRYLDPIREFALEELVKTGEEETFSARHAYWATQFAERLAPELLTGRQAISIAALVADADNLRGAILWAKDHQDAETALRLTSALWRLMEIKGFYREGCARLRMALSAPNAEKFPALRSKAFSGLSVLAYRQGDLATAEQASKESLKLERTSGTRAGVANAINDLGNVSQQRGQYYRALRLYRVSLALERGNGNARGIAVALFNTGRQAMNLGKLDEAIKDLEESLKLFDDAGNQREASFALNSLGKLLHMQGRDEPALRYADRSLQIRRELGDQRGTAEAMRTRAAVLVAREEFTAAFDLLKQSGDIVFDIGDQRGVAETLEHLALLANAQGSPSTAAALFAAAQKLRDDLHAPLPPAEHPARDAQIEHARSALGVPAFAAEWEKGLWTPPKEAFLLGVNGKSQAVHAN